MPYEYAIWYANCMNSKLIGHFTTFKCLINLQAARKNCGPHGGGGGVGGGQLWLVTWSGKAVETLL